VTCRNTTGQDIAGDNRPAW